MAAPRSWSGRKCRSRTRRPGEVLIAQKAVGLNYIDVYFRTGLYKAPAMPVTIGMEGAGVVEAVGDGVTEFAVGDRVAYAGALGAYAEYRCAPADKLVKIPEGISFKQAAAMMLQGMTAQFLVKRTYAVKQGETILVHAAAGGVGSILIQWAKHLGATVIGVVSTPGEGRADQAPRRRPCAADEREHPRPGQGDHPRRHAAGGL